MGNEWMGRYEDLADEPVKERRSRRGLSRFRKQKMALPALPVKLDYVTL